MKKLLLVMCLICTSSLLVAQKAGDLPIPNLPVDEKTKLVTYQEVVQEPGSIQELYDRAMIWVKKFYPNYGEVIKSSDREKGVIELRSSVKIYVPLKDGSKHFKNVVYYNFKIECRPDRYRYTITDFNEKAVAAAPIERWFNTEHEYWEPNWYHWLNQINDDIVKVISDFEEGMLPVEEEVDEW